ncbi:MAG: hypothetical protein Q8Q60_02075 [Candidatus Chromulinivorax sp.]|nr:hypothetical protein [Candidatus Chromulinivorax sp.]
MNTTRNILYKKLFAISLTGMLLSSPASMLAEQNQSPDAGNEQTRAISTANQALLNKIKEIVVTSNSNVVTAITGGNPENNLGTVIPELQAAIEELQDDVDAIVVATADILAEVDNLDTEIGDLADVVADIPTSTQFNAAIADIEGAGFDTDTDSLKVISDNIDSIVSSISGGGFATSDQAIAIQGAGFVTGTDSLEAISNTLFSTNINIANIQGSEFSSTTDSLSNISNTKLGTLELGTTLAGNLGVPRIASLSSSVADVLGDPNDAPQAATSIVDILSDIEGAGFVSGTNGLIALTAVLATIQKQAALTQVVAAASNSAITTIAVTDGNDAAFNAQIDILLPLIATAITTPNNANIVAVQTQIDAVPTLTGTALTTGYSIIAINAGINQLEAAVDNWLTFYPA